MLRHLPLAAASLFTVVWIGFISWWLRSSSDDLAETCSLWSTICALRELSLNEFGDFLAGTFSVLAFLWMATAVVLQGAELRRQRVEFAASTEALQAQTKSMLETASRQEKLLHDEALKDDVSELLVRYSQRWPETAEIISAADGTGSVLQFPSLPFGILRDEAEARLRQISSELVDCLAPVSQFDYHFSQDANFALLEREAKIMRMETQRILDSQYRVSARFSDSQLFGRAEMLKGVCELILSQDHQTPPRAK